MSAALALLVVAVLLWPGRPLPVLGRRRPALRSVRPGRTRRTDDATLAELFAAALDAGLPPLDATRWCARQTAEAGVPGAAVPGSGPSTTAIDDACAWWRDRVPAVGRALAVAERLGSPAAPAVRAAADAERDRVQADAELRAGLAGVRATAWLLTALPFGGVVLAAGLVPGGPAGMAPAAWVSVGLGAGLTALGRAVLNRLVRRARRRAEG